jgi:hypothetical protein
VIVWKRKRCVCVNAFECLTSPRLQLQLEAKRQVESDSMPRGYPHPPPPALCLTIDTCMGSQFCRQRRVPAV